MFLIQQLISLNSRLNFQSYVTPPKSRPKQHSQRGIGKSELPALGLSLAHVALAAPAAEAQEKKWAEPEQSSLARRLCASALLPVLLVVGQFAPPPTFLAHDTSLQVCCARLLSMTPHLVR